MIPLYTQVRWLGFDFIDDILNKPKLQRGFTKQDALCELVLLLASYLNLETLNDDYFSVPPPTSEEVFQKRLSEEMEKFKEAYLEENIRRIREWNNTEG